MSTHRLLERIADAEAPAARAPSRLKSRVYSALVSRMAAAGPLEDLVSTKAEGGRLCVFEEAVAALPIGDEMKSKNPCRVCHARVLAEHFERPPIFWPGCPYSDFCRR
jgi:hypothetical protein